MNVIESTMDYSRFKFLEINRKVVKVHVDTLIELNEDRDRFHLFPIVVDPYFNIIDGQHRFTACREMGKPVHYVVDRANTDDKFTEITKVNTAANKHTCDDVIRMLEINDDQLISDMKELYRVLRGRGYNGGEHTVLSAFLQLKTRRVKNDPESGFYTVNFPTSKKLLKGLQTRNFIVSNDYNLRIDLMTSIVGYEPGAPHNFHFKVFKCIYTLGSRNGISPLQIVDKIYSKGFNSKKDLYELTMMGITSKIVLKYNVGLNGSSRIAP